MRSQGKGDQPRAPVSPSSNVIRWRRRGGGDAFVAIVYDRPVMPPSLAAHRSGHTLPELVVALALVGMAGALAVGSWHALTDRARARMAAADLATLLAEARDEALARARVVAARFDTSDGSVTLRAGTDTLAQRRLAALHGVRLLVTRDSVAYSALGLGRGLANARFVLVRGSAAETVWVSRLGRVRVGGGE